MTAYCPSCHSWFCGLTELSWVLCLGSLMRLQLEGQRVLESNEGLPEPDLQGGFFTPQCLAPQCSCTWSLSLQQNSLDFFHCSSGLQEAGSRNSRPPNGEACYQKTHFYRVLLVKAATGQTRFKKWRDSLPPSVKSGMHRTGSTICGTQGKTKMQGPLSKKSGKKCH